MSPGTKSNCLPSIKNGQGDPPIGIVTEHSHAPLSLCFFKTFPLL
jgi:hypothetical protein